jgi:hypothetical protein
MVGGGDERIDASGVAERHEEVRACRECGFCEDGGGVMEDERSDDVPGAASMEVAGEADRWRSCLAGRSSSWFCGVEGLSTGVDSSKEPGDDMVRL